jgi:hypothetical protein
MGWNSRLGKSAIFQVDGAGHRDNQDWDYGVDRGCDFWRRWAVNGAVQWQQVTSVSTQNLQLSAATELLHRSIRIQLCTKQIRFW